MSAQRPESEPPAAEQSLAKRAPERGPDGRSALRAYVTCPTQPNMRAISGHHPVALDDSLYPTQPPEADLHSHSRVRIDPIDTPASVPPESDSAFERRTPTTDRCAPL